jgi:integrase
VGVRADPLRPLLRRREAGEGPGLDRLGSLTALIGGPSFDRLYRSEVIQIPPSHPVYGWECVVAGCERPRGYGDVCGQHRREWAQARAAGVGKAEFLTGARPLRLFRGAQDVPCRVCPQRPAAHSRWRLCHRHMRQWYERQRAGGDAAGFGLWVQTLTACAGYGPCRVVVCPSLAYSPLGLCFGHEARYRQAGRPGGAVLPRNWHGRFDRNGLAVPVSYAGEKLFGHWCMTEPAMPWPGQVNLRGLRPLVAAEIRWGLHCHAQRPRHSDWHLGWLQTLVNICRQCDAGSLADLGPGVPEHVTMIAKEMVTDLRLVYFTPASSREAGFLETGHFGIRFRDRIGHFDLTGVSQRWLRDLLWDYLADMLRSAGCPRTAVPLDNVRRACLELSAFLQAEAPGGGDDPAVLQAGHAHRFAADQRHRERHGLASLAITRGDGTPSAVTANTRAIVFGQARRLLRYALDTGRAEQLGLDRAFITAMPGAGSTHGGRPRRRPFPDEVARALAGPVNLAQLAAVHDAGDQGLRDIWETIILTGRRVSEVIGLRLECTGRYGGLPMLWHDQAKVGNYDAAIRIPERLHQLIEERQHKTAARFAAQHGRPPTPQERTAMALFPSQRRNPGATGSLSYPWFLTRFRSWIDQLDLGHQVPHQARHTLATSLLRHGATLAHIRRYLGHVSDRMAEHYVHLSHTDLEDVLNHVWVAGPGSASPGDLLSGGATPLTREQAQALAVDLSRRSTPAEGGFCTFQPVVDGRACPWNLAPLTELTTMFRQFMAGFRLLTLICPRDRIG